MLSNCSARALWHRRPDGCCGWAQAQDQQPREAPDVVAARERRMAWWHEARFGMFIHWGAYSVYGRHEWAM